MKRITLPGDEWAEVREPSDLTNGQRKTLRRAAMLAMAAASALGKIGFDEKDPETWAVLADITEDQSEPFDTYQAKAVLTGLIRWSLPIELPTEDTIDDLPTPIYDALVLELTGLGQGVDYTVDGVDDPKAGTGNLKDSAPSSAAKSSKKASNSTGA